MISEYVLQYYFKEVLLLTKYVEITNVLVENMHSLE